MNLHLRFNLFLQYVPVSGARRDANSRSTTPTPEGVSIR
jgi:hypothetical protein